MGLDVSLISKTPVKRKSTGVFYRENGKTLELTPEQVKERFPDTDVEIEEFEHETKEVYSDNITHNLNKMAMQCGLYDPLWHPKGIIGESGTAKDLIPHIEEGLNKLKNHPEVFKKFNPENGWGDYDGLVRFAEDYLEACKKYPEAIVSVWR